MGLHYSLGFTLSQHCENHIRASGIGQKGTKQTAVITNLIVWLSGVIKLDLKKVSIF